MRTCLEPAESSVLPQGRALHAASDVVGRVHASDCAKRCGERYVLPQKKAASLFLGNFTVK